MKVHLDGSSNWNALKAELNKQKETVSKDAKVARKLNGKRKRAELEDADGYKPNKTAKLRKVFKSQTNKQVAKRNIEQSKPQEIWFDDIPFDEILEADSSTSLISQPKSKAEKKLVKTNAFDGMTKAVAMDCEMVGIGEQGRESVLARVSLVNQFGKCIYDKYVKSREVVTDYRTFVSGIRPEHLVNADDFELVQKEVADILQDRILVGHALWNDMKVLFLDHPKKCIRDTARYKPFRTMTAGHSPALRVLCSKILGVQVQKGEHSSVQDAQAAMRLYTMVKKEWESEYNAKKNKKTPKKRKKKKSDAE